MAKAKGISASTQYGDPNAMEASSTENMKRLFGEKSQCTYYSPREIEYAALSMFGHKAF